MFDMPFNHIIQHILHILRYVSWCRNNSMILIRFIKNIYICRVNFSCCLNFYDRILHIIILSFKLYFTHNTADVNICYIYMIESFSSQKRYNVLYMTPYTLDGISENETTNENHFYFWFCCSLACWLCCYLRVNITKQK